MKTKHQYFFIALALSASLHQAAAQGTQFTYQGRLTSGTNAANGTYDLTFSLFTISSGPGQVASSITNAATPVSNGLFTVTLDFGANFPGANRWLEIGVRTNGGGAYTTLSPRQALTATPYAIMAGNAANLGGQTSTAFVAKAGDTMTGTLNLPAPAILDFGAGTRQMISLYDSPPYNFGIGVQTSTFYQRTVTTGGFAWYEGGVHNNGQNNPGGGTTLMTLSASGNLQVNASGGVYAITGNNPTGTGVAGSSSTVVGVYGVSGSGRGVQGNSVTGEGVYGFSQGNNGVHGLSVGNAGYSAVWGENTGNGYGVRGTSASFEGVHGETSSGNAAAVAGINLSTGPGLYGESRGGGYAGYFVGPVRVCTLQIYGGCDLAEPFPMKEAEIDKGSVVVIDDEHPGRLKMSDQPYDTRVAGIVSGAKGINPGVSLSQQGVIEGGQNVALSGRVYVLADASDGMIKPGDLLTTSSTPGHAMKVANHAKAQGAILGKAMSSLKEGKGMVLVLVTLQ